MDLLEIATMARELMDFHGLQDWIFKFNRSKYKKYGNCCYSLKTINITSFYSFREASYDSLIKDTILHEIAHALVGRGHEHDSIWKAKCIEIGCIPNRFCESLNIPRKYLCICPIHGQIGSCNLNKSYIHKKCGEVLALKPNPAKEEFEINRFVKEQGGEIK